MKIGISRDHCDLRDRAGGAGTGKASDLCEKLGASLKEVKKVTGDLSKDIRENIVEPLDEASAPLKEAIEPIVSLKEDVNKSIDDGQSRLKP